MANGGSSKEDETLMEEKTKLGERMQTNEKLIAQYSERANLRQDWFHSLRKFHAAKFCVKPKKDELKQNVKNSGLTKEEFEEVKRNIDEQNRSKSDSGRSSSFIK